MKAVTVRDINLIIPKVGTVVGIVARDTQNVTVVGINCDAAEQCYGGFFDKSLSITENHWNEFIAPEFASDVDATIVGNTFSQNGDPLKGYAGPKAQGVLLDFGFAFGSFVGNTIGPSNNEGISTFFGMHDNSILGNTLGWNIGPGDGMDLLGAYRNVISNNTLAGGSNNSSGIVVADTSSLTVQIDSDSNLVWNNVVNGYTVPNNYICSGTLGTDNCFDPTQLALKLPATKFVALGTPPNGSPIYCTDCTVTTPASCMNVTNASACTCKGSGLAALAKRISGVWLCN